MVKVTPKNVIEVIRDIYHGGKDKYLQLQNGDIILFASDEAGPVLSVYDTSFHRSFYRTDYAFADFLTKNKKSFLKTMLVVRNLVKQI